MTMQPAFAAIQAAGLEVYAPFRNGREPTYAFFTDGKNIGYIQADFGGFRLTTVHVPNRQSGTGYSVMSGNFDCYGPDDLTPDVLSTAFAHQPSWARNDKTPVKYRDWDAFAAAYWDRALERVAPVSECAA